MNKELKDSQGNRYKKITLNILGIMLPTLIILLIILIFFLFGDILQEISYIYLIFNIILVFFLIPILVVWINLWYKLKIKKISNKKERNGVSDNISSYVNDSFYYSPLIAHNILLIINLIYSIALLIDLKASFIVVNGSNRFFLFFLLANHIFCLIFAINRFHIDINNNYIEHQISNKNYIKWLFFSWIISLIFYFSFIIIYFVIYLELYTNPPEYVIQNFDIFIENGIWLIVLSITNIIVAIFVSYFYIKEPDLSKLK